MFSHVDFSTFDSEDICPTLDRLQAQIQVVGRTPKVNPFNTLTFHLLLKENIWEVIYFDILDI